MRKLATITETVAHAANDPKRQRLRAQPVDWFCRVCHGKHTESAGHSFGCEKASREDMIEEVKRARHAEKWKGERADYWLLECRRMHATIAALKHEVKALRKKLKP